MDRRVIAAVIGILALAAIAHYLGSRDVSGRSGGGLVCPGCNVVIISVETTRADHLGCYGYPRNTTPYIDSLASDSFLFENAFASRAATWPSLTSMLTGRYPVSNNVRDNGELLADSAPTLARILEGRGYVTAAYLSHFCEAGSYGFDVRYCSGYSERGENDVNLTAEAIRWLDGNGERPFFLWMHYFKPHSPYYPPDGFDAFSKADGGSRYDGGRQQLDTVALEGIDMLPRDVEHVIGLYDGGVLFADTQVGGIVRELEGLGLMNRTVLVVTSDHGEDLYQRNHYFYHECSVYDSSLHIPLIVRVPGVGGGRVPEVAENVDVAPTILELLNVSATVGFDGRSLAPLMRGDGDNFTYALSERFQNGSDDGILSIRSGRWHYIYNPMNVTPHCLPYGDYYRIRGEELYDLAADPLESKNVVAEYPAIAEELRGELLSKYPHSSGTKPIIAGNESLERLRSLGYLV
jgi:arylsulfatase A-like enzyme